MWGLLVLAATSFACKDQPDLLKVAHSSFNKTEVRVFEQMIPGTKNLAPNVVFMDNTFFYDQEKKQWCQNNPGYENLCGDQASLKTGLAVNHRRDQSAVIQLCGTNSLCVFSGNARGEKDLSKDYLRISDRGEGKVLELSIDVVHNSKVAGQYLAKAKNEIHKKSATKRSASPTELVGHSIESDFSCQTEVRVAAFSTEIKAADATLKNP